MKFCPKCNEERGNDSTTFCPVCYTKLEVVEHKKEKTKDKKMIRRCVIMCITAIFAIIIGINLIKPGLTEYIAAIENPNLQKAGYENTINVTEIANEANQIENIIGLAHIVLALIIVLAALFIIKKKKIGAFLACGSTALLICIQMLDYAAVRELYDKINPEIIFNFPTGVIAWNCGVLLWKISFFKDSMYFHKD